MICRLVMLGVLLLGSSTLQAHTRSLSYSYWQLDGQTVQMHIRLSQFDLTRLQLHPHLTEHYDQAVLRYVQEHLHLARGDQVCLYTDTAAASAEQQNGWISLGLTLHCPEEDGTLNLNSQLFAEVLSSHQHVASLQRDGQTTTHILHPGASDWSPQWSPQNHGSHGASFLKLGWHHILSGWDHLAFVMGLLLLARRPRDLIWLISGFTLGHSLSLAGATLGLVAADSRLVESMIGLSIALLAVELAWRKHQGLWLPGLFVVALIALSLSQSGPARLCLWGMALFSLAYFAQLARSARPQRWQLLLSSAFGLIHGFGFAGLLADLQIAPELRPWALLQFNIGVELGQLAVVAGAGLLLSMLQRWRASIQDAAIGGLACLGSYWLLLRLLV